MTHSESSSQTMLRRPTKTTLTVSLPPEFRDRIEEQMVRESRSASEIVREALRVYWGTTGVPASVGIPTGPAKLKAPL